jgi:hypothetical protein
MSRTTRISRTLLSLLVLMALAFTLHSVESSDASFATSAVNPGNIFVAGTLAHENSQNGQLVLVAGGLEPGDSCVGTMTLTGNGDVAGTYTLSASSLVNVPVLPELSDALDLTIEDITGAATTLYNGAVSDFDALALGAIPPGAARSYRLTLAYPSGPNDAALQGATMTLVLRVTGVSS